MASWWQDVESAIANLGGIAAYKEIYQEVARLRGGSRIANFEAVIRKEIERHSSDSRAWEGKRDLFYSVDGLGKGVWGLRSQDAPTPEASDMGEPDLPDGVEVPPISAQMTFRVIRETALVRHLKKLHRHECQLCTRTITLADGERYSEGHHIRPLGRPHRGPDIAANIIVVCPTCHVLLDYFAIPLDSAAINGGDKHQIASEYLAYHNAQHREAILDGPAGAAAGARVLNRKLDATPGGG